MATTDLLLTTRPGLEDLLCDELLEGIPGEIVDGAGEGRVRVRVAADAGAALPVARAVRLAHHVHRVVGAIRLSSGAPLDSLRDGLAGLPVPELEAAASFGVRCRRRGSHAFTSADAERAAGAGVRARRRVPVDLRDPTVWLQVDIVDDVATVMVRCTRAPLDRRYTQATFQRAAANPVIAAALCRLVPEAPAVLLDPFCGGGTLLLEAAHAWPEATLLASDADVAMQEGAAANLLLEARPLTAHRAAPAEDLDRRWADRLPLDLVLANPPFGKRLLRSGQLPALYRGFLTAAARALRPGGHVAMLAWKRRVLLQALADVPDLECRHARVVNAGGLWVGMLLLQRR